VKKKLLFSLVVVIFLATYSKAYAHRVYFFAYADAGKVVAEGYFVDGRKAINSLVEVFDKSSGKKLLEGKTNNRGQFAFSPPKGTNLKLTIDAGMGHKAEFELSSAQIGTKASTATAQPVKESGSVKKTSVATAVNSVNMSELKKLIDDSLDEKLRPVIIGIEKSENSGTSFQSIVGGFGYIFGLMGAAMYFSSKGKS